MNKNIKKIFTQETETDLQFGLLADSSKLKPNEQVIYRKINDLESDDDSFLVEKENIDSDDRKVKMKNLDKDNDNKSEKSSSRKSVSSSKSNRSLNKLKSPKQQNMDKIVNEVNNKLQLSENKFTETVKQKSETMKQKLDVISEKSSEIHNIKKNNESEILTDSNIKPNNEINTVF